MDERPRYLPPGWYPDDAAGVKGFLRRLKGEGLQERFWAKAAIAPHAGWDFSGRCAWLAWQAAAEADVAVVIGGHLPEGWGFLSAPAARVFTPLGSLSVDAELDEFIRRELGAKPDDAVDNTVEIHLPMLKSRFPDARLGWFRAPNGPEASRLGLALARYAQSSGKRLFVLGSTDLTHYGPSYGWMPGGRGQSGRQWAREADEAITQAYAAMDEAGAMALARERAASCSVGAAVAAIAFARAQGADRGRVLATASSADIHPGESFVGYCSVAY